MEIVIGSKVWHSKKGIFGVVAEEPVADMAKVNVDVEGEVVAKQFQFKLAELELLNEEEFQLVSDIVRLKNLKTELNKQVEEAKSAYAATEDKLAEYLRRRDLQSTRVYAGIGKVAIDGMVVHPSITIANQELAFAEIRNMGRGEIIKESIHPKTLQSFMTELIDAGQPTPAHVGHVLKPKFSITKK